MALSRLAGPVLWWDEPIVDALDAVEDVAGDAIEWDNFRRSGRPGRPLDSVIFAYRDEDDRHPVVIRAHGADPIGGVEVFVDGTEPCSDADFGRKFGLGLPAARVVLDTVGRALGVATVRYNEVHAPVAPGTSGRSARPAPT